ncbi:MAG: tRNA pseudouridine(54/55) synthase Pus10 [Candidatus Methanofastidiosia archaeon]
MDKEAPHLCAECASRLGLAQYESKECDLCGGILQLTTLLDSISPLFEYSTFSVGVVLPKEVLQKEAELVSMYKLCSVRGIKTELNKKIREYLKKHLGKEVDVEDPDAIFEINYVKQRVFYRIKSLTLSGRYNKYDRGLPQTKWYCKSCRGRGCKKCNFLGKMYPTSVEEIIAAPLLDATHGKMTRFHGAGREDIDVQMLGDGRPFVIEILNPKVRTLDLEVMQSKINEDKRIHVACLSACTKPLIEKLKNTKYKKTYLAYLDKKLTLEEISKIEKELTTEIEQRTPIRVSHRRSDKIRKRKVYKVIGKNNKTTELEVYCDGGLYIKELISGDKDRTIPSVSSILEKQMLCKELDVIKIHCDI